MKVIFCHNCGTGISEYSAFCASCGTKQKISSFKKNEKQDNFKSVENLTEKENENTQPIYRKSWFVVLMILFGLFSFAVLIKEPLLTLLKRNKGSLANKSIILEEIIWQDEFNPKEYKYYLLTTSKSLIYASKLKFKSFFNDGVAIVFDKEKNENAYVDENLNKIIVYPKEYGLSSFNEGYAWITEEYSSPILINKKNEQIFQCKFCIQTKIFSEDLAGFKNKNGQWGYLDTKGNIKFLLSKNVEFVGNFSDGLAKIYVKDSKDSAFNYPGYKIGFINKNGETIIKPKYNSLANEMFDISATDGESNFKNGFSIIMNSKWKKGLINKKGELILSIIFDDIYEKNGRYIAKKPNKDFEFIATSENPFIKFFDNIFTFKSNDLLIPKSSNGRFGFINERGGFIIQPKFDSAEMMKNGLSKVVLNGKEYLINSKGDYIFKNDKKLNIYTEAEEYEPAEGYTGMPLINLVTSKEIFFEKIQDIVSKINYSDNLSEIETKFKINNRAPAEYDWLFKIYDNELLTPDTNGPYFDFDAICTTDFYNTNFDKFSFSTPISANENLNYSPSLFLFRFSGFYNTDKVRFKDKLISDLKMVGFTITNSNIKESKLYFLSGEKKNVLIIKKPQNNNEDLIVLLISYSSLENYSRYKNITNLFK